MKYDNVDYARERLSNTVVRIKKQVVYLSHHDGWSYRATDISTRKNQIVDIRKIEIDIKPIPLGYINFQGSAYYASRRPVRRWKQGLSEDAISFNYVDADGKVLDPHMRGVISSKNLADCVNNIYPTLKEAYLKVYSGKCAGVAFSRVFAISHSSNKNNPCVLLYKGAVVGVVNYKGINLDSRYYFLKELLEEVLV